MAEDPPNPKRAVTIYGDRGELRPRVISAPGGVPIVPDEFAEAKQPITNVGLTPIVELGARVERARSDSAASATVITSQLAEHASDIKALKTTVGDLRVDVAEMAGELRVLPELVTTIRDSADRLAQREHLTFTRTLEVDTAGKLSGVKVGEAKELDVLDSRKARRWFIVKLLGSGVVGGIVLRVLQHFGVL